MANRVHNELKVSGKKEHMKPFLDKAIKWKNGQPQWQVTNTLTTDGTDKNLKVKDHDRDWYEENLGTKWDSSTENGLATIESLKDCYFEVYFDSAWTPPYIWLEKMIAQYPNINFKLFCTEEMLSFTAILYNDENGNMVTEYGKYKYWTNDGLEICRSENNEWLVASTNEPVNFDTKIMQLQVSSNLSKHMVWFEKEKDEIGSKDNGSD